VSAGEALPPGCDRLGDGDELEFLRVEKGKRGVIQGSALTGSNQNGAYGSGHRCSLEIFGMI
jgi:hypothetical protein